MVKEKDIPGYNRAFHDASSILGATANDKVLSTSAVMFGCGGDDGYWMRILGAENFSNRRAGCLMVSTVGVAYAEPCATYAKPESSGGTMLKLLMRRTGTFKCFTWMARIGEIEAIDLEPIHHASFRSYALLTLTVGQGQLRFGLGEGSPSANEAIAALRHVAGKDLPFHEIDSHPTRTDGIYVFAGGALERPFQFLQFRDDRMRRINSGQVAGDIDWPGDVEGDTVERTGNHYLVARDTKRAKDVVVGANGRLLLRYTSDMGRFPMYGDFTQEYDFVPYSEIVDGWGWPTVSTLPAPDWLPVLTASGKMEAPNIGAPRARMKS